MYYSKFENSTFSVLLTANANVSHRIKWLQWKVLQRMSNSIIYSLISLEPNWNIWFFNKWIERKEEQERNSSECSQAIESHQHQQMRDASRDIDPMKQIYSWLIHEQWRIETRNQSIQSEFQRQINALAWSWKRDWERLREREREYLL